MLNSRTKWVLALLVIFLVTLASAAGSTAANDSGKAVYQNTCAACHETGVSGAPKIGDKTAWDSRIAKGKDRLVQSVLTGLGAMPPKAGNPALSKEEIRAAVDYMVDQVR
jgi:cytochrome c5